MLKAAEVVIAENAHGFYCVPRAAVQRPAARKIINGEVWEPETIDFVVRHCVDRSVVHAGAFFGDFLPAVSRALVADAVLYAAEPNPENHASSLWTVRIKGCARDHPPLPSDYHRRNQAGGCVAQCESR